LKWIKTPREGTPYFLVAALSARAEPLKVAQRIRTFLTSFFRAEVSPIDSIREKKAANICRHPVDNRVISEGRWSL